MEDTGVNLAQYHTDFEYVSRTISENNIDKTTYYFWVQNKAEKFDDNLLSAKEITNKLTTIDTPYMFYQLLQRNGQILNDKNQTVFIPNHYEQVIVRGLSNVISENDRYKLRFIQDFVLRDDYNKHH